MDASSSATATNISTARARAWRTHSKSSPRSSIRRSSGSGTKVADGSAFTKHIRIAGLMKSMNITHCLAFGVVLVALAFGAPAAAQTSAPGAAPSVTADQAENLLKTLEDPEARQKFTDQLRAFVQAQRSAAPAGEAIHDRVASRFLESLSETVAKFGESIFSTATFVADAPNFIAWLQQQWGSHDTRDHLREALGVIALVLASAGIFEWVTEWLLAPTRRRLEARQQAPGWSRVPSLALYLLVETIPIAAFLLVAFALLAMLRAEPVARLVTLAMINANIFAGALSLVAAGVLAPRNPGLRLLPLGDEMAGYLFVWGPRVGDIAIYGYFAIEAGSFVGLPYVGREFLLKMLGVFVALLLIILVLQNRATVASSLTTTGNSLAQGLLRHIVPYWHVLAIGYVVVALGVFLVETDGFTYVARAPGLTLCILGVAALLVMLLRVAIARVFRIRADVAKQVPHLEAKTNRYLQLLNIVGTTALWALAALAILQASGLE